MSRLRTRGYPRNLVEKIAATVSYKDRAQLLQQSQPPQPRQYPPLYKCPPPPQYKLLKQIVIDNYHLLQNRLPAPRFIPLRYQTLSNQLVKTRLSPTNEQLIDIHIIMNNHTISSHNTAGQLPQLHTHSVRTKRCNHSRCATCRHLNCSKHFISERK